MSEPAATPSECEVADVRIHCLSAGSGPDVVYLHHSFGNPGWHDLLADLAADHRVHAPDLPGYCASTRP